LEDRFVDLDSDNEDKEDEDWEDFLHAIYAEHPKISWI
jgi:hypothetical protein